MSKTVAASLTAKTWTRPGCGAAGFEDRGHPVFLPEVFARDHFDLDAVLAGQADDVLADLPGDRLGEAGQVARTKACRVHRHQQRARVGHIDERPVENDAVKTAEAAGQLVRVPCQQIAARLGVRARSL